MSNNDNKNKRFNLFHWIGSWVRWFFSNPLTKGIIHVYDTIKEEYKTRQQRNSDIDATVLAILESMPASKGGYTISEIRNSHLMDVLLPSINDIEASFRRLRSRGHFVKENSVSTLYYLD